MDTCGIITEYNPMHLGHAYQLNEGKKLTKADHTILVMSGNFVQRGEPALINKYLRTKAALKTGIDLVIELPVYFSTSSAEYFSHHAIKILNSLGVVSHINFGSEIGDIHPLETIAEILYKEPIGYKVLLNDCLKEGMSFPKARATALLKYNSYHNVIDDTIIDIIKSPNNILGIEYIKALKRLDSSIIPTTVKRVGSHYHDNNAKVAIPSATAIREHIKSGHTLHSIEDKMPCASYAALKDILQDGSGPLFYEDMFELLKYKLLTTDSETLKGFQDVTEGLENRILEVAKSALTYDDLIEGIISKRYTRTKIARALLHIFLGHTKKDFESINNTMNPYVRVLGFNKNGQGLLKAIKKHNEELPIIVNVKNGIKTLDPIQRICFEADLNATMLYNHMLHSKYGTVNKNDYQNQVIMI